MKRIGVLGHGVFGQAMGSLISANGYEYAPVDVGDTFPYLIDTVVITTPVQVLRAALTEHAGMIAEGAVIINCSKGIEVASTESPYQIASEIFGIRPYACVAGPSFASEVKDRVPTIVTVAGTDSVAVDRAKEIFARPYFVLEELGTVRELELAGAMKNVYAVASGYVAGSGGGKNTHAQVQVMALREYTRLIQSMAGKPLVVRPGVVGDLILTCGSEESRNYQYGKGLATGAIRADLTAEGVATAEALQRLAQQWQTDLPLVTATKALIDQAPGAKDLFYQALGFQLGID